MPHISVTRLQLRSWRFLPLFMVDAIRANRQVARAPGFLAGSLLGDLPRTFWTLTAWDASESMRGYMLSGPHRKAMPRLATWCDEASVVHWEQPAITLPPWPEAIRRMRETGRPSSVRHPSPRHADLSFSPPRMTRGTPIRPR